MRRILFASLALGLGITTASAGEPSPKWSQVGVWQIRVDSALSNGCYMATGYTYGGNNGAVRIGINPSRNVSYLLVGFGNWKSIQPGNHYSIEVGFNGAAPVTWDAIGYQVGDDPNEPALLLYFNNSRFWQAFAKMSTIQFYYNGSLLTSLSLTDTDQAVQTVLDCQRNFTEVKADPFSDGSTNTDPFAAAD